MAKQVIRQKNRTYVKDHGDWWWMREGTKKENRDGWYAMVAGPFNVRDEAVAWYRANGSEDLHLVVYKKKYGIRHRPIVEVLG